MSDDRTVLPKTEDTQQTSAAADADLARRIGELHEFTQKRVHARRRRWKLTLLLGGAMALVSTIMLFRLSSQSRELTTDTMLLIARAEIEKKLPVMREKMQDRLQREAPNVVRNGMQSAVDAVPGLRVHVTRKLNARFDRVNERLEKRVALLTEETIRQSKEDLEKKYPDLSDREKLEKLADEVAMRLRKALPEVLDAMYPEYASEIQRLQVEIEELYDSEPEQLTREQQIKRELLRTMVRLAHRDMGRTEEPADASANEPINASADPSADDDDPTDKR